MGLKDAVMRARTPEDKFNEYSLREPSPIEKIRWYTAPEPETEQATLADLLTNLGTMGSGEALGAMTGGPSLALSPMIMGKVTGETVPIAKAVSGQPYAGDFWRIGPRVPNWWSHWFDASEILPTAENVKGLKAALMKGLTNKVREKAAFNNPAVFTNKAEAQEVLLPQYEFADETFKELLERARFTRKEDDLISELIKNGLTEEEARLAIPQALFSGYGHLMLRDAAIGKAAQKQGIDALLFRRGQTPVMAGENFLVPSEVMLSPEVFKKGF